MLKKAANFSSMHRTGRTVKDKNNTLSSEDLREILRSDESEDELVEFIKNSFPKKGPAIGNNNKTRSRTSAKPKDEELMHEIDLDAAASITSQPNSTRANVYDLSANGESIILGCRKRSARLRTCLAIGLYISFFALVCILCIVCVKYNLSPCEKDFVFNTSRCISFRNGYSIFFYYFSAIVLNLVNTIVFVQDVCCL